MEENKINHTPEEENISDEQDIDRVGEEDIECVQALTAESVPEECPEENAAEPVTEPSKPDEKTAKKKRLKKILGYALFILLNALVVAVLLIVEDKSGDMAAGKEVARLMGGNILYTLLAFGMFFLIATCDSIVFKALISKTGKPHSKGLPIKVTLLGRYYDRITPWAMGGEPFQIAYLMGGGLSAADSCAVTMSRHIVRFFTNAVLVITILIASQIATEIWVMVVAILSVLAGLVVPVFMLICSFKPKLGRKIGSGVVGLLHKMKIVKNYDKQMQNMQRNVDNFLSGLRYLATNKKLIVLMIFAAAIELFANNSVPFFVIRSLGHGEVQFWHTFVLCIFVNYASSFAPTPGGAGIAELSFYAIFAASIGGGYLFWAVLFWRIAVFYVPVFIGFVLQTADSIATIVRTGRAKN